MLTAKACTATGWCVLQDEIYCITLTIGELREGLDDRT